MCGGSLLIAMLGTHLFYNVTPSAPLGFYWYTPLLHDVPLRRGELALIIPPAWVQTELHRLAPGLNVQRPWMKTIAATAGDTVCLDGDHVTINEQERGGRPLLRDYPLAPLNGCTVLPEQTYFVMNDHPRSFDSRYVGPLPRARIHGTLAALVTWKAEAHP
jgi:conjugative transfer signal peptidase TraF